MGIRTRMLFASILLVIIPAAILAYLLRREMQKSLEGMYAQLVSSHVSVIKTSYEARSNDLVNKLDGLRGELRISNDFYSAAVVAEPSDRTWLLDYATSAMKRAGLDMLQIQDSSNRILSSGHFRNNFDSVDDLPDALNATPGHAALIRTHTPERTFLALARVDTLMFNEQVYSIVGGLEVNTNYLTALSPSDSLAVTLYTADGAISSNPVIAQLLGSEEGMAAPESFLRQSDYFVESFTAPVLATTTTASPATPARTALFIVSYPRAPLRARTEDLESPLWLVLIVTAAGTLLLAALLSALVTGPIVALAKKTAGISLDHLDADFSSKRSDEVGVLSRFLEQMTGRLRGSVGQLREAENRATLGELARQVNHDIRNGFTPIRNVIRHLSEVARDDPANLARVFRERQATLESSLLHVEDLATNYKRISPNPANERVQVNDIVRHVVTPGVSSGRARFHLDLARDLPVVVADRTGVRRVIENLVRNARESLDGGEGSVTISTRSGVDHEGRSAVILSVSDTGCGIAPDDRSRIFEHFYTSKARGTGLGLSIVQRIVSDNDGKVEVQSELGRGSCFTVTLPAVPVQMGHTAPRGVSASGSPTRAASPADSTAPGSPAVNVKPIHLGEDTRS